MEYLDDFQGFPGISVRSLVSGNICVNVSQISNDLSSRRGCVKTSYVCRMAKTGISEKSDFWEIEFEFLLFGA